MKTKLLSRRIAGVILCSFLVPSPSFCWQGPQTTPPTKPSPQKPKPKTPSAAKPSAPIDVKKPSAPEQPLEIQPEPLRLIPGAPAPEGVRYTGLVIDCTGLDLHSTPSPKLMCEDGTEVYGTISVPDEYLSETGIVAYPKTLEDAVGHPRIGGRPMIVKALRVDPSTHCDPVISLKEAKRLRAGNEKGHFLERCAVVFLMADR